MPLLGLLAGSQNNTRGRTELLVLITPHVVHDQRDARALTEDLRDQLINAAAVPDSLQQSRASGSADPHARCAGACGWSSELHPAGGPGRSAGATTGVLRC